MAQLLDQVSESETSAPWLWRKLVQLEAWTRPVWGWGVLIGCMLLTMLPAVALRANRWLDLDSFQSLLEMTGPLAVAIIWLLWGWRRQTRARVGWQTIMAAVAIGIVVLSQLLLGWLPGPGRFWQALQSSDWSGLLNSSLAAWARAISRFSLWREGVAAGGAAQDNLVFATFGSTLLWLLGMLTAWLARKTRQGFATAAPALWLLTAILLYSSSGRFLLLMGLALMLALHIMLDQGLLSKRWQEMHLDYSPGLLVDRLLAVLSAGAIILTIAAVMPNLYYEPLVTRYYALLAPMNLALEDLSERLFPDLRATSRLRGGGGGMPNEFLLQGGPNTGSAVVMRVRTDEAPTPTSAYSSYPFDEMAPPPSHYMRGRTLTLYDGLGWRNPPELEQVSVAANQRWEGATTWGRKQVVQSVILEVATTTIFAAPEPVELSTEARLEIRSADDQVTLTAREPSYSVVSMVPAVDELMLRELPFWSVAGGTGVEMPEEMQIHLALPESVTERTRELAQRLVEGQPTAYDKARAIEQYLRQYLYDLEVPEPPEDVTDVADYFLFELQRGYCDYYATAFVVMARSVGLPARFATGFAPGSWNGVEGVWVISEGDAHSWPEVYFPEVGWVPFEPTAGRSELVRVALPVFNAGSAPPPIVPAEPVVRDEPKWNWQLLFWLVPLAIGLWLLLVAGRWWLRRREDPWQALLQWGSRAGRPMAEGETVLEYGEGLAGFVIQRQGSTPDAGRIAAREIQAVSVQVNRAHYSPADERTAARQALEDHWSRLRSYLPLLRIRH